MASGPLPKDPSQRVRRNVPARGDWTDLHPIEEPVLPELPDPSLFGLIDGWDGATLFLWNGLRYDPATALFTAAEVTLAVEAMRVHTKAIGDDSDAAHKTCYALLDKLGLTPKGKKDLRLRVVAAPVSVQSVSASDNVTDLDERRQRLMGGA